MYEERELAFWSDKFLYKSVACDDRTIFLLESGFIILFSRFLYVSLLSLLVYALSFA